MLRSLLKKLTNNLGLKALALLFSVVLWMGVVNLDDPIINKVFTIAVTVENESAVTSAGKYFEIINDSGNVTFSVSGKRSVLDKLSVSDFKATADMTQMIQKENENIIPVEITALRYSTQITISRRAQEMEVSLEDLMTTQFVIQAIAQGTPADGYTLGDMDVTPNLMKVSGPKSEVSKIQSARATIDVTGMTSEITDNVIPTLLDEEGNAVDTTRMTLNLSTVTVKADILSEKTAGIRAEYSGTPAEGYEVVDVSVIPQEIKIKGKSDVLNAISTITIPEDVIRVDDADEPFEQQVDITKYLPEGASISDSSQASVTVRVDVEQLSSRTFTISTDNIDVDNLPEGYRILFNARTVEIVVFGLKADLDELSLSSLRPVLDVSGMAAGSHVGQLAVSLDDKYIVSDTMVSYTIVTETAEDTSPDENGQDQDTGTDLSGADTSGTTAAPGDADSQTGTDTEDKAQEAGESDDTAGMGLDTERIQSSKNNESTGIRQS